MLLVLSTRGLGWTDFELAKVTAQTASTDGDSVKNLIAAVDKHKQGHSFKVTISQG